MLTWKEVEVNSRDASWGYRGYEGVVFKPPAIRGFPAFPVFVKELELRQPGNVP